MPFSGIISAEDRMAVIFVTSTLAFVAAAPLYTGETTCVKLTNRK